jgi:hypothetical protein
MVRKHQFSLIVSPEIIDGVWDAKGPRETVSSWIVDAILLRLAQEAGQKAVAQLGAQAGQPTGPSGPQGVA